MGSIDLAETREFADCRSARGRGATCCARARAGFLLRGPSGRSSDSECLIVALLPRRSARLLFRALRARDSRAVWTDRSSASQYSLSRLPASCRGAFANQLANQADGSFPNSRLLTAALNGLFLRNFFGFQFTRVRLLLLPNSRLLSLHYLLPLISQLNQTYLFCIYIYIYIYYTSILL